MPGAIVVVYRAKRNLEDAARHSTDEPARFQAALIQARTDEREAIRALEAHTKEHGCEVCP